MIVRSQSSLLYCTQFSSFLFPLSRAISFFLLSIRLLNLTTILSFNNLCVSLFCFRIEIIWNSEFVFILFLQVGRLTWHHSLFSNASSISTTITILAGIKTSIASYRIDLLSIGITPPASYQQLLRMLEKRICGSLQTSIRRNLLKPLTCQHVF